MSILDHVKYKHQHQNSSTKTGTNSDTNSQSKRMVLVKRQTIQTTGQSTEVVPQRPSIPELGEEKGNDSITISNKRTRTPKGANPNKDIIQRANKGAGHKLKSFGELANLFDFPEEPEQ